MHPSKHSLHPYEEVHYWRRVSKPTGPKQGRPFTWLSVSVSHFASSAIVYQLTNKTKSPRHKGFLPHSEAPRTVLKPHSKASRVFHFAPASFARCYPNALANEDLLDQQCNNGNITAHAIEGQHSSIRWVMPAQWHKGQKPTYLTGNMTVGTSLHEQ
jgi:hypothetical protein